MDTSNVVSIELVGKPEWPPCAIGEPADYRGIQILAKYRDGSSEVVDVTPRYLNESNLQTTQSPRKSIIQVGKCRVTAQIPLLAISLDHIEAKTMTPLVVRAGEWVDREKIRVHAVYSDGSMKEIYHFKLIPHRPVVAGQDAISVRYGRQQVSLPITVYVGDGVPEIDPLATVPSSTPMPFQKEEKRGIPPQMPSVMNLFDDDWGETAPPRHTTEASQAYELLAHAPANPVFEKEQPMVVEEQSPEPQNNDQNESQQESDPFQRLEYVAPYASPKVAPVLTPKGSQAEGETEAFCESEKILEAQPVLNRPGLSVRAPGLTLNVVQSKQAPAVLTQVGVSVVPDVRSYLVGDTEADLTGGKLSLLFSDGHMEEIPMVPDGDVVINSNMPGKGSVSFQYQGQAVRFTIDVYEPILQDLHIARMPDKMDYIDGDVLDLTGMVLELVYPAGITRTMANLPLEGYVVTAAACAHGLTLELGGIEFSIPILVRKPVRNLRITGVELGKKPDTTVYEMGSTLDITGAELKVIWSDGHIETVPVNEDMVLPVNLNTPGETEMIMYYRAFEVRCPLKVTPRNSNLPPISIVPQPAPFFVPANQDEREETDQVSPTGSDSQPTEEEKAVPDYYMSSFSFRFLRHGEKKP